MPILDQLRKQTRLTDLLTVLHLLLLEITRYRRGGARIGTSAWTWQRRTPSTRTSSSMTMWFRVFGCGRRGWRIVISRRWTWRVRTWWVTITPLAGRTCRRWWSCKIFAAVLMWTAGAANGRMTTWAAIHGTRGGHRRWMSSSTHMSKTGTSGECRM